jgi:hypothetical protein
MTPNSARFPSTTLGIGRKALHDDCYARFYSGLLAGGRMVRLSDTGTTDGRGVGAGLLAFRTDISPLTSPATRATTMTVTIATGDEASVSSRIETSIL